MADANPELPMIIVSGNRKLLYHITALTELLKKCPNLHLATGNFCNDHALERLVAAGLGSKLLYGSMMPYLDAGNTLAMIALGQFNWETKCAIAGNNLRRLLGKTPILPAEIPVPAIKPFIVDAHTHTHNLQTPCRFEPYCAEPSWNTWQEKLTPLCVQQLFITPDEAIMNTALYNSRDIITTMCRESAGNAWYFEVFNPDCLERSVTEVETSLADPMCVGIKLHPVEHHVYASDPRYEQAFRLAAKFDKAIMTHSWGISDYNPNQRFATPEQFAVHLEKYPQVRFVFGHCGGRPNGYVQAVEMCRRFPQTACDLAGDFFHNGLLAHAVRDIGPDRIIFASDLYWIDPRCMLGMLLETDLPDSVLWKIFRENAIRTYRL